MNNIFAEFASPILLILKGLLVGIIASAPMGPVGVLCIQRTIQKGRNYGIVTGAGAALSDAAITFTFHNVSIKSTDGRRRIRKRTATLHSTMYLLNLSDRF